MAREQLIRCASCGTINRVSSEALSKIARGERPVCGRCKTPLAADSRPVTVTDAGFAAEVEQSALPVVVDLWAPWCGPCRMLAPMIDELSAELAGRVRFAKLNIDENPRTAARFGVRSIPTLLVFRNGRVVDQLVGVPARAELERRIARALEP